MILQYRFSLAEAGALRAYDRIRLVQLNRRIRKWIFESKNVSVSAWQLLGLPIRLAQLGPTPQSSGKPMSKEATYLARMSASVLALLAAAGQVPQTPYRQRLDNRHPLLPPQNIGVHSLK